MNTDWPTSIRGINALDEDAKRDIYMTLIPDWLLNTYEIDPETLCNPYDEYPVVQLRCPAGSRALEISLRRRITDRDPVMYLNMADTFNNQLLVLLVVINDPDSARFNVDVDLNGNSTHFGTSSRNIPAEIAAMRAGLSPGQIRSGLRVFKQTVPMFEEFVLRLGHDIFFIEPLAYHNAIVFERYGFNYLSGKNEMIRIHNEFQAGGELLGKLDGSTPFRHPDAWRTVRGRSWAIHDGILGHPFTGFQMYKRIGKNAGINTFPGSEW